MPVLPKLNKYFIESVFNKETYSNVFRNLYSNPFISKLPSYQNPWALLLQWSYSLHVGAEGVASLSE